MALGLARDAVQHVALDPALVVPDVVVLVGVPRLQDTQSGARPRSDTGVTLVEVAEQLLLVLGAGLDLRADIDVLRQGHEVLDDRLELVVSDRLLGEALQFEGQVVGEGVHQRQGVPHGLQLADAVLAVTNLVLGGVLTEGSCQSVVAHHDGRDQLVGGRQRPVVRGARKDVGADREPSRGDLDRLGQLDGHERLRATPEEPSRTDGDGVVIEKVCHVLDEPLTVGVNLVPALEDREHFLGVVADDGLALGIEDVFHSSEVRDSDVDGGLDGLPVVQTAQDVIDGDGVEVVVGLLALKIGTVVPCVSATVLRVGEPDEDLSVEPLCCFC